MQQVKSVFIFSFLLMLLAACNQVDFKKTSSGIPYKVFEGKGGDKIAQGNFVKLHVVQKIKDSVLYSTHTTMPQYIQVSQPIAGYDIQSALMEVLPKVKTGDSLQFVQAMDTFIKQNPQIEKETSYRKGDQLITGIRVVKVFKNQAEYQADMENEGNALFDRDPRVQEQMKKDEQIISEYLTANKINAQKVGKGTYVQILEPGSGPKAQNGQFVSVMYKGYLMNGKVFDTNMNGGQPLVFQLGSGSTIKGFEEGLRQMSAGSKARIFIPSLLAYGSMQPSADIQPFTNLIFDLELLQVSSTPPPGAQGPAAGADTGDHSGHAH